MAKRIEAKEKNALSMFDSSGGVEKGHTNPQGKDFTLGSFNSQNTLSSRTSAIGSIPTLDSKNKEKPFKTTTKLSTEVSLHFVAYRSDPFGTFVKHSVLFTTLVWFILFMILILDFYEKWEGPLTGKYKMIFIDHENLAKTFILVWHLSLFWFLALQICSNNLLSFFLIKTRLVDRPEYVSIVKSVTSADESQKQYSRSGFIMQIIYAIEKPVHQFLGIDGTQHVVATKYIDAHLPYVEFECVRYVFDYKTYKFEPFDFKIGNDNQKLHLSSGGLSDKLAFERMILNGPNEIIFVCDSMWTGILKEFTGMFYLYQMMMLIIWCYYAYYYMAIFMTIIIISSGVTKVTVSSSAQKKVLDMVTFTGNVNVLRGGEWTVVENRAIVPGDVIEVKPNMEKPLQFDCVIIEGDAVLNEASLTGKKLLNEGEALPVAKTAVQNDAESFSIDSNGKRHCLFAGCMVLETRTENTEKGIVKALVLATGGATAKNRLVKDMLFPAPLIFVFNEQLKVVIPVLMIWGLIVLFLLNLILPFEGTDVWFYGMTMISQILSPILPAVLVIGQSISAGRLASKQITCIDLARITMAGKVKVFCFDKTGTMTNEGLDFIGVMEVDPKLNSMGNSKLIPNFSEISSIGQQAMMTCHSLALVNGKSVGNFVDTVMFQETGAKIDQKYSYLIHPSVDGNECKIVRRFEFIHSQAYQSVIGQDLRTGRYFLYMKGSFEKLASLCKNVPADFAAAASLQAQRGSYVVALAYKEMSAATTLEEMARVSREDMQFGAQLLGIMLFRNEMRPDTAQAIANLRMGAIRPIMITGDHPMTAIHIGHQSQMILVDRQNVLLLDLVNNIPLAVNFETKDSFNLYELDKLLVENPEKYEIVITGAAFRLLISSDWINNHLEGTN